MLQTTAQRFGSLGKSFVSPSTAAAVIGAALLASGTTDEAETAWSPAAACLLPDVLPVAGTLLSYGGDRQLAAGGTVTHSGVFHLTGDSTGTAGKIYLGSVTPSTTNYAVGGVNGHTWINAQSNAHYVHIGANDNWGFAVTGSAYSAMPNQVGMINAMKLGWGDNPVSSLDAYFVRNSASSIGLKGASGIDAAVTCGAITASGYITSNSTAPGFELKSSGTRVGFIYYGAAENRLYSDTNAPWVVESNAGFKVRNLANTADAALTCGAITASGNIILSASNATISNSNDAASDGIKLTTGGINIFRNTNDFASLDYPNYLGLRLVAECGVSWTSSGLGTLGTQDTSLSRNAAGVVQIGTTAHNALGSLACAAITTSGNVQETPTQSALDPTTTNIPSGKRQGWYNSTLSEFRDWVNIGGTLLKSAAYT